MAQRLPEAEDPLCRFYRVFSCRFSVPFFNTLLDTSRNSTLPLRFKKLFRKNFQKRFSVQWHFLTFSIFLTLLLPLLFIYFFVLVNTSCPVTRTNSCKSTKTISNSNWFIQITYDLQCSFSTCNCCTSKRKTSCSQCHWKKI